MALLRKGLVPPKNLQALDLEAMPFPQELDQLSFEGDGDPHGKFKKGQRIREIMAFGSLLYPSRMWDQRVELLRVLTLPQLEQLLVNLKAMVQREEEEVLRAMLRNQQAEWVRREAKAREAWVEGEMADIQTELESPIRDAMLTLSHPEEPLQFYVLKHRAHHETDQTYDLTHFNDMPQMLSPVFRDEDKPPKKRGSRKKRRSTRLATGAWTSPEFYEPTAGALPVPSRWPSSRRPMGILRYSVMVFPSFSICVLSRWRGM